MADDDTVRALLTERAGYLRAGKTARVEAVDEQLRLRGYSDAPEPPAPLSPAPASRGRRTTKG